MVRALLFLVIGIYLNHVVLFMALNFQCSMSRFEVNMVVKTQHEGLRISGLYVGITNVRRYFSRRIPVVELQLDHLRIQCGLAPRFWNGQPEINDPRLCDWLEAKLTHVSHCRTPMLMSLIPSGKHSFKLASINSEHKDLRDKKGVSRASAFIEPRPAKHTALVDESLVVVGAA
jgi:hypothetical protein